MSEMTTKALFYDAEQKAIQAKIASNAAADAIKNALLNAVPPGSIINLTRSQGNKLPDYLVSLRLSSGSLRLSSGKTHGTSVFRVERLLSVDFNATHPDLTTWSCAVTPISEKTGKDMNGGVAHSLSNIGNGVVLKGQVVCEHTPDEDVKTIVNRLLDFVEKNSVTNRKMTP